MATDAQVLAVAAYHSTRVAAAWAGVHVVTVRAMRSAAGQSISRGHPSKAQLAREAPRMGCPCPYCDDARTHARQLIQAALHGNLAGGNGRWSSGPGEHDDAPSWRTQAACLGAGPREWFPVMAGDGTEAKAVCRDLCPVRAECLEYALANKIDHGTWGGESERSRRRMLKARRTTVDA